MDAARWWENKDKWPRARACEVDDRDPECLRLVMRPWWKGAQRRHTWFEGLTRQNWNKKMEEAGQHLTWVREESRRNPNLTWSEAFPASNLGVKLGEVSHANRTIKHAGDEWLEKRKAKWVQNTYDRYRC